MTKGNRKRRQELGLFGDRVPDPSRKCHARKTNGAPCGSPPLKGQAVCRVHGGSAPQAIRKAKERIALASGDAVTVLVQLMSDPRVSPSDRRQAAVAILDRAGISTRNELEVTVAPWVGVLEGVVADLPDDSDVPMRSHRYGGREVIAGEVVAGEDG